MFRVAGCSRTHCCKPLDEPMKRALLRIIFDGPLCNPLPFRLCELRQVIAMDDELVQHLFDKDQ